MASLHEFPMREQPPSPDRIAQLRDRADALDALPRTSDQHRAAQVMDNPTIYELQEDQSYRAGIVADALAVAVYEHGEASYLPRLEQGKVRAAAIEAIRTLSPAWRGYAVENATDAIQVLLTQDGLLDKLWLMRRDPAQFRQCCAEMGRAAMIATRAALQDETPSLGVYLRAYAEDLEAGR